MRIDLLPITALRPALHNPRQADKKRLELVRLSLAKLGFLLPIVATADGEILSGHQRHAVAVGMGAKKVPVMVADVPERLRRGVNILFNRATNDTCLQHTERDMGEALAAANVRELAARLPDISPDSPAFFPCLSAAMRPVEPLARLNVERFVRHAANVGRMLARLHVHLPIVVTAEGVVVNGIGRLEAAARKGRPEIAVVTLDADKARLARAMLNFLSMDFSFEGDSADFLRYGAFRREWLRRAHLGTAFVLPVQGCRHKRLSDVRLDAGFMRRWKAVCGDSILDFGCGQGDEAAMLRRAGIEVTEFEPYPAPHNVVSRQKGRASAMRFLAAVRTGRQFSAIFVSSVLNSVPFPADREHILRIVAALCGPDTLVCAAARATRGGAWKWMLRGEAANARASRACNFPLGIEAGLVLGDLTTAPKAQKFFDEGEFRELFRRFFASVNTGLGDGMVTAMCKGPLAQRPGDLAASLRFEFNLPYPDGRMELASKALEAFSARLGLSLEAL